MKLYSPLEVCAYQIVGYVLTTWRQIMGSKERHWFIDIDCDNKEDALSNIIERGIIWHIRNRIYVFSDMKVCAYINGERQTMKVTPLSNLITDLPAKDVQALLDRFRAGGATAFDIKMRKDAIRAEKLGTYRTFLLMTSSGEIVAYVMLGLSNINIPDGNHLSERTLARLNLDKGYGVVPAYKIVQMSWSVDWREEPISLLIELSYELLNKAVSSVGGEFVILECDKHQASSIFFDGFRVIEKEDEIVRLISRF